MSTWRSVVGLLAPGLPSAVGRWLQESAAAAASAGFDDQTFGRAFSAAGRTLGRGSVSVPSGGAWPADLTPGAWSFDELGRVALLLAAIEATPFERHREAVERLFRNGELRERQALLRALPALPGPERFIDVAAEAVRSNIASVLEAIGCDNSFPAAHLPELLFNQMVMKLLFGGLPLDRVVGLPRRRSAELVRMAESWVSERRAAGRPIPDDTNLILAR